MDDVVDVSNQKVDDKYLVEADEKTSVFHRYSKEQVQRIVELVYMPHQVAQYNTVAQGQSERHCPTLSREGKPVRLEDILPRALEEAGRLFDIYNNIPKGTYYFWEPEYSTFFSLKRFNGFVTKSVDFWFSPFRKSSFEVPDIQVFIPWGPSDYLVNYSLTSSFYDFLTLTSENDIRDLIKKRFKEHYIATIERRKKDTIKRVEEAKQKGWNWYTQWGFSSWEDYTRHRLDLDEKELVLFETYRSRSKCRELGFIPKTGKIRTAQRMANFVIRFLNQKEPGPKFNEKNYLRMNNRS